MGISSYCKPLGHSTSKIIKSQNCKIAKSNFFFSYYHYPCYPCHSMKTTKSQNLKIAKSQNRKIAKSQNCKIAKSQNRKIAKLQNRKIKIFFYIFPHNLLTLLQYQINKIGNL